MMDIMNGRDDDSFVAVEGFQNGHHQTQNKRRYTQH